MTTDLDALIAEADALVESWDRRGSWGTDSPVGMVMRLAAELRQERERADEAEKYAEEFLEQRNEYIGFEKQAQAALSRAEETIDRIDGEVKNFEQSDNDALCEIERHLTEYDKQKEANRG